MLPWHARGVGLCKAPRASGTDLCPGQSCGGPCSLPHSNKCKQSILRSRPRIKLMCFCSCVPAVLTDRPSALDLHALLRAGVLATNEAALPNACAPPKPCLQAMPRLCSRSSFKQAHALFEVLQMQRAAPLPAGFGCIPTCLCCAETLPTCSTRQCPASPIHQPGCSAGA